MLAYQVKPRISSQNWCLSTPALDQVDADHARRIWAKLVAKNDHDQATMRQPDALARRPEGLLLLTDCVAFSQDGLMDIHEWTAFVQGVANLGKLDHLKQQLAQMQAAS